MLTRIKKRPKEVIGGFLILLTLSSAFVYLFVMQTNRNAAQREEKTVKLLNETAVDFSLKGWEGETHQFQNLNEERFILLNFWASWCEPCVEEIPSMIELADQLPPEKFQLLLVNVGESWKIIKGFFEDLGGKPKFMVLSDPEFEVSRKWGSSRYPETYLVGPGGRILDKYIGKIGWNEDKNVTYFQDLIRKMEKGKWKKEKPAS